MLSKYTGKINKIIAKLKPLHNDWGPWHLITNMGSLKYSDLKEVGSSMGSSFLSFASFHQLRATYNGIPKHPSIGEGIY